MRKFSSIALVFGLIIGAAIIGARAQSAGQGAKNGPAASVVMNKPASPNASVDELVTMLPVSDLIATLDVNRAFNELLPKLAGVTTGGVDKLAKSVQDFTQKTG